MAIPLYEMIFEYLLTEIREGRLKGGDRVMSERELADHFGVSTMTSKGALARLAAFGVIVRARGRGSFVAESLPDLTRISQPHAGVDDSVGAVTEGGKNDIAESRPGGRSVSDALVGLVVPGFADSFGVAMVRAMERRCSELGMHLLIRQTNGLRSVEDEAIEDYLRIGVDGLIVMPVHGEHYNANILRLVLDGFPVVLVDRYLKGIPACAVYTDNVVASLDLTNYLFGLGHRQIAFVSPPSNDTSSISDRLHGFMQAFSDRGVVVSAERVYDRVHSTMPVYADEHREELIDREYRSLLAFVESQKDTTAYVACEYEIALLLKKVLATKGLLIPEDCTVVCFDHYHGVMDEPFFTHVKQDEDTIGRIAVEYLEQRIIGNMTPTTVTVPHRIIDCQSTASIVSI